jgi:methylglutaconyl-CoA hydratase
MKLTTLRCETSPRGIATITLDRPDRMNAFDQMMLDELTGTLQTLDADPHVRLVVLRATGKHFSSGADMSKPANTGTDAKHTDVKHTGFIDIYMLLECFTKPTISVVQGACVGGSAALVACCDLIMADNTAFFSLPQIRSGVAPVGVAPVLIRAMGLRAYRRLALSGTRLPAAEAHHAGLVDEVHASSDMETALDRAIEAFLLGAPGAQAELKAHLNRAYPGIMDELHNAHRHHAAIDTFKTPEALEGVSAFLERRKPAWYPPR